MLNPLLLVFGGLIFLLGKPQTLRQIACAIRHCTDLDRFRIEAAGDVVSKIHSMLAANKDRDGVHFSSEGLTETRGMHDKVIANISLAGNVLVTGDEGIARKLLEEKKIHVASTKKWEMSFETLGKGTGGSS